MTPAEHAEQRARDYVHDRGWRQEPLSWEEVAALLDVIDDVAEDLFHIDEVTDRIAGVALSKIARRNLAEAFAVSVDDLTPRAAS